ncbi:MAG: DEAD/DEAH box helicase [Candidatus Cloacimonetes bacterium]|nr:DEAD/DEAH box helicase [Candidatus Cloacimonadota bacterium]
MARLFGREYHESSNTWYYKSSVMKLEAADITLKKYRDEQGCIVLEFRTQGEKARLFPLSMKITYDPQKNEIINWGCLTCRESNCRHYLSIIDYAYHNLTTDQIVVNTVQTYDNDLLEYDEYWQQIVINAQIEISDIYNNQNDKIRFHFSTYQPMNIRLISMITGESTLNEQDKKDLKVARKQMKALTQAEMELLRLLNQYKCSYSRKGDFYTIYKDNFRYFFNSLQNLQQKIVIRETGEHLEFIKENFRINFSIVPHNADDYVCRVSTVNPLSASFMGTTTWVFMKNQVAGIKLPFQQEIARQIFGDGYILKKEDLVYFSSVVARQLGLIKCYIDFDEDIVLPAVFHNFPRIVLHLRREENAIIIRGELRYNDRETIPLSVINLPVQLARFDQDDEETWFYIPPQIKYSIKQFFLKLPPADDNLIEESSELIFRNQAAKEALKKVVFEFADPSWDVNLTDELKKEFIYKVELQPIIKTRKSDEIRWFEYEVEYKFKDISFTHDELKKFFKTKEKYLKLDDGRLLYFQNTTAFEEVEKLVKRSSRTQKSESWKLSVYNLTYLYQLPAVNQGINIEGDSYLDTMVNDILQRHCEEVVKPVNSLQPVMRSYQKAGYRWLKMLQHYGLSGILADDMGLGKTLEALSLLADLPAESISLVVCPKTLLFNWAAEIKKFCPFLSYIIYEGPQKERRVLLENPQVNIVLASYSIISSDLEIFSEISFDYIILDEAQHIKNVGAQRTRSIKKLQARHRLCLTGTPIENNTTEIWSLFDFMMPGYLPPQAKFRDMYSDETDRESRHKMKLLLTPFLLRRRKDEVLIELPDKQIQTAYCSLTPVQEKLYLQILQQVKSKYFSADASPASSYLHILAALTRMRQICNHPSLVNSDIKDDVEYSGKVELLRELIQDAVDSGHKLLVFSQFVGMLQILKKLMKKSRILFEYMDGSTVDRQIRIENFNNNNKIRVFLISLKTGGYGLNLTAADTVIITDPWWNPMGENQAIDRAHRIGQTQKVLVYKTITRGTIEEKIQQLQQSKREMFDNLIEDGQTIMKNLSVEELRDLLESPFDLNKKDES